MADYSSLWTSSRDPEFQQIKKVKQLTERHLAMHVSEVEKTHKRQMKKTRDHIRDAMVTLECLEQEKEKRARHILAAYLKHQHVKEAARVWTVKMRLKGSAGPQIPGNSNGSFAKLFNGAKSSAKSDARDNPNGAERSGVTPFPGLQIQRVESLSSTNNELTSDTIQIVEKTNKASNETVPVPSNEERNFQEKHKLGQAPQQKNIMDTLLLPTHARRHSMAEKVQAGVYMDRKRPSLSSLDAQRVKPIHWHGPFQEKSDTPLKKVDLQKQSRTSSKVYMTHTFPYVYHSEGEKPCPRYGMFRECTDYDPFSVVPTGRKNSKMTNSREASMVSDLPVRSQTSKKSSLSTVALAVKLVTRMHRQ